MNTTRLATLIFSLGLAGAAVAQGYGPPPGPPPPPPGQYGPAWNAPPTEYSQYRRQGFEDGVQGAQRDFQNHRIWNVRNRDEYRHPPVPRSFRRDYRDGFEKGYYSAVRHFQNGAGPYGPR